MLAAIDGREATLADHLVHTELAVQYLSDEAEDVLPTHAPEDTGKLGTFPDKSLMPEMTRQFAG